MDTYRGCMYDCRYCFARDIVTFHRRKTKKPFTYLVGNRPDLFEKWIKRTMEADYNYDKGEEVAFKECIPLKIGATSDPFPLVEGKEHVTFDMLKVLHTYDYPTEIQTKNPSILADYFDEMDIDNPNWIVAVTLISTDEGFLKVCEPNAPSASERLESIKALTKKGINAMVKIQPAIYPKILEDLPDLVKGIKEAGCWAFNMEGLKVRISMMKEEQMILKEISDYLGYDIRETYKKEQRTGSDWELLTRKKKEYTDLAVQLGKKHDIKFFSADNDISAGDGCECCGTEVLHDYKILNSLRNSNFETKTPLSSALERCKINFCRRSIDQTIGEALAKERSLKKQKKWLESI